MSTVFSFSVKRWAVWAAELDSIEDWRAWSEKPYLFTENKAPKVANLDPMLRRRCSKLTRMSLEVAQRCLEPSERRTIATVFGSRNGESQTTITLLNQLAQREMLSPMKFGLSVHNTTAGLFGIANENRSASTAVAAGKNTFVYTILEAVQTLQQNPAEEVLLVISEEKLPKLFCSEQNEHEAPFALALLLSTTLEGAEEEWPRLQFSLTPKSSISDSDNGDSDEADNNILPQGLRFIKWLFLTKKELRFSSETIEWYFHKDPEDTWASTLQVEQHNIEKGVAVP